MKRLVATGSVLALTLAVSAAFFHYGSAGSEMAGRQPHSSPPHLKTAPVPSVSLPSTIVTGHSQSAEASSPDGPERDASNAPSAHFHALRPSTVSAGSSISPASAVSPPAAPSESLWKTDGRTAAARSASPAPASATSRVSVPKVAIPLAFQSVDLFVATPQGLRYSPVNFPSGNGTVSAGATTSNRLSASTPAPGAPGTLVVDESVAASLEDARRQFIDAVGGLNQDAADPAYEQRWRQAQRWSDQQFRKQYGDQAFNRYQIAAAQKAEAERQAATNGTP